MRAWLVVTAAVAAAWVPAAPAITVTAEPPTRHPRSHVLPDRPDRPDRPGEGCTLPVSTSLESCGPGAPLRPPVSCVLPVDLPPRTTLVTPECPRRDPAPEGRIVPVTR